LPWYMFDIYNLQLITSITIPMGEINDTKEIFLSETPIPGKNFAPISPGGNGNRKISFTLPVIMRNNSVGNMLLLKQFDLLRNQAQGFLGIRKAGQFNPNPKVLYSWGTGSVPLIYYVAKCEMKHTSNMVNQLGNPQHSLIDIELVLDETNLLYKAEEMFRNLAAVAGMALNLTNVVNNHISGRAPF